MSYYDPGPDDDRHHDSRRHREYRDEPPEEEYFEELPQGGYHDEPARSPYDRPSRDGYYDEPPRSDYHDERPRDRYYDEPPRAGHYDERPRDGYYDEPSRDSYYDQPARDGYYDEPRGPPGGYYDEPRGPPHRDYYPEPRGPPGGYYDDRRGPPRRGPPGRGGPPPTFNRTTKGITICIVGLLLTGFSSLMLAFTPIIVLVGAVISLIGFFMLRNGVKSEIKVAKSQKRMNVAMVIIILAVVVTIVGGLLYFAAFTQFEEANDKENSGDRESAIDLYKNATNMFILGFTLIFIGFILIGAAIGTAMLAVSYACFDEYQSKVFTKFLIGVVPIILSIGLMLFFSLVLIAEVNELDEDSTQDEVNEYWNAVMAFVGSLCLSSVLVLIGYIFLVWESTTAIHGLKQVTQEYKRKLAGW